MTKYFTSILPFKVETLQEEVATIKRDIQKFHSEDTQMDNTRKAIMKDLEVCPSIDLFTHW